jgi:hypothetical protein
MFQKRNRIAVKGFLSIQGSLFRASYLHVQQLLVIVYLASKMATVMLVLLRNVLNMLHTKLNNNLNNSLISSLRFPLLYPLRTR